MAPVATTINMHNFVWLLFSLWAITPANGNEDNTDSDTYYDTTCVSTQTSPNKLTPNTFHKICPETTDEKLGQPICGDGTAFSFAYTSPLQRKKANDDKIVIEFQVSKKCTW